MEELSERLSRLLTPEMNTYVENRIQREAATQSKNLRRLPPDPMAGKTAPAPNLNGLDESDPVGLREACLQSLQNTKPRFPPPEMLPCANVQAEQYTTCQNQGKLACSACKLVSYCSKKCQGAHWKFHKRDCRSEMRSDDWEPIWIVEDRPPSFVDGPATNEEDFRRRIGEELSIGYSLWGNTPAMDVINLAYNEKDAMRDFSLAFVASGDLRHVVHTINALPSNFSGNLDILVNDVNLSVICRNIVLLLILGTIPDEIIAADIALHFWYSTFMPVEYHHQILSLIFSFLQRDSHTLPLGSHSTLSCCLPEDANEHFLHFISSSMTTSDAQDEYDRVRNAPSRHDYRDRLYLGLRPSHRVAFLEFRRFGIVLPFGAINAHFNSPNYSLFSLKGKWLQTDYADPLEGWNISVIIKAGKAHCAQPEDIYGCLYFFLSEQLRMFARRLRNFKISFKVLSFDACQLSKGIRKNVFAELGIPKSIRFDRIAVSNILDANYVGLRGVLTHWAPLLAETRTAVIVGYFMNWVARQEDGRASAAGSSVVEKITKCLMHYHKVRDTVIRNPAYLKSIVYTLPMSMDALYDNSKPFSKFLAKEGLEKILHETNVLLREKHTIVPHRDLVSLEASPNALPEFPDEESWYYHTKLSSNSWSSRYVEFTRR